VAALERSVQAGEGLGSRGEGGCTALHFAADRGHLAAVEWLLAHGADVDARDEEGQTAAHYAALCGRRQVRGGSGGWPGGAGVGLRWADRPLRALASQPRGARTRPCRRCGWR
jgi:hypothetical protein